MLVPPEAPGADIYQKGDCGSAANWWLPQESAPELEAKLMISLHSTYQADQRDWLIGVRDFLGLVRELRGRQRLLI